MKKLLLILLCLPFFGFGQLGDYYKSNGHPKAKGLNFQIKTPLGFEKMEADRPNIVQKWIKNPKDNNTMVLFMILVKNLPTELKGVSKEDWMQYLKYESGVKELTESYGIPINNEKYYVLDNYPGIYFESIYEAQRLDNVIKLYQYTTQVFIDDYFFTITMQSPKKHVLEENLKLFYSLANSVIFPEQYGN